MKNHRNNKGYTLIELMIVIVIIGFLAAIVMPQLIRGRYHAVFTSCQFNLRAIASALENYQTDYGEYPSDELWADGVLTKDNVNGPPYIRPEPVCPSNGQAFRYIRDESDKHDYIIYCQGIHHLVIDDVQAGYPRYSPSVGLLPHGP